MSVATVDIHITNGRLVDPWQGVSDVRDVFVKSNRIITPPPPGIPVAAEHVVNAEGCLVLPGLIDFHAHIFYGGTDAGISPDASMLPMGVTTAVDGGSCGAANYESFVRSIACSSRMRLFGLLNVCSAGLITGRYHEELDPACYDEKNIARLMEKYPGQLLGLKVRQSQELVGDLGVKPLEAAVKMAEKLRCPVVVHATNPPVPADKLAGRLRPGDVFCHVHHGSGHTILGEKGSVKPALRKAQRAGVIFDAANGRNHFSLQVAAKAIAEGFLPDIISTDVTAGTLFGDLVFGLPYIMMKYLALGMSIEQVVAACTAAPARYLGLSDRIGTLKPGALADVAIFRLLHKEFVIRDKFGKSFGGGQFLVPQMTVLDGKIVFRQIEF